MFVVPELRYLPPSDVQGTIAHRQRRRFDTSVFIDEWMDTLAPEISVPFGDARRSDFTQHDPKNLI